MKKKLRLCTNCKTPSYNLKRCSKCKKKWYCSVECQKKNWKFHKKNCKKIHKTLMKNIEKSKNRDKRAWNYIFELVDNIIYATRFSCNIEDDPVKQINAKLAKEHIKQTKKNFKKNGTENFEFFRIRECNWHLCPVITTESKKLKLCNGCEMVYYCSLNCQKKDWKSHKEFCKGGFIPFSK